MANSLGPRILEGPVVVLKRVIAYIDGFNLYFGMRSAGLRRCYWLDVARLGRSLLKPDQTLVCVHYFTARIQPAAHNRPDVARQSDYLQALAMLPDVRMHFGHYLSKRKSCRSCGAVWEEFEEKMTDVSIATQLLVDSYEDQFDTALLISADSDLTPPVLRTRKAFPEKRVIVAQPPKRNSVELKGAAHGSFTISETKLRQSQLPNEIPTPSGYILRRPEHWQ